ncbi:DNA recombination protein RmuC [Amphiplicatus metriothermophilus]|nr:DNA recombination protein RmuC [Amphiplicatus metriothermophilus]MBB5517463.1 DNA anti-recombination protein RmuC/Na+-transporting methylmalonyl-CoA/oxaloacetate decarboxylase gamma subunit [Amphiplicatus metriothermophilus]
MNGPTGLAPAAPEPILTGEAGFLWTGALTVLGVFLIVLLLIMRGRAAGAAARRAKKKESRAPGDFFQPAGETAEIAFEEDAPPARQATQEEAAPDDDPPAPAPQEPRRQGGPFAGLFAKKKNAEERAEERAEPVAAREERPAPAPPPRRMEPPRGHPLATARARDIAEEAPAPAAAEGEVAYLRDWRRGEAEAERRQAAEESRSLAAAREAEFERRKLAAAFDQRQRALEMRAEALSGEFSALQRELADELDRRFVTMSNRLEERFEREGGDAGAIAMRIESLERRLMDLAERIETRIGAALATAEAEGGDRQWIDAVSHRLAEHRESVNATLASLSNQIDVLAGAPEDIRALREDIAALRRAMGERVTGPNAPQIHLADIVRDALAPGAYDMRARLSNNRTADCLVRVSPALRPTGIDARFPLETFFALRAAPPEDQARAENEFRRAALRHLVDVAERLISPEETADFALAFIPSESMYAELHARFPDVVQDAYRAKVWFVSPTTLTAALHAMRAAAQGGSGAPVEAEDAAAEQERAAADLLAALDELRRRVAALEEARATPQKADSLQKTDAPVEASDAQPEDSTEVASSVDGQAESTDAESAAREPDHPPARSPFPLR